MKLVLPLLVPVLLLAQKTGGSDAKWMLTFADEFEKSDLDLSKWSPHDPLGRPNAPRSQEQALEAIEIGDGHLRIIARSGRAAAGTITTFGKFAQMYGRFEIRCNVPTGRGLRPRFRLLPIPLGQLPGIDVFETTGSAPSTVSFANHWGTEQTERSFGDSFAVAGLSTGFHTFAIEWDKDKIVWFVDGKEKFRSLDGVAHQPMFLELDLAAAEAAGLPGSFDIDYIHVYQRN
jgi:beta-glucanase (GH16 family)